MVAVLISLIIVGVCFGFGHLMNPTNTTEYNYSQSELWEPPAHWKNWEKNKNSVQTEWEKNWKQS